jgi:hypothetical protein
LITDPELKLLVNFSETSKAASSKAQQSKLAAKAKSMPSGSPAPRLRSTSITKNRREVDRMTDDEADESSDEVQIRKSPRRVNTDSSSSVSLVNLKSSSASASMPRASTTNDSSKKVKLDQNEEDEEEVTMRRSPRRPSGDSTLTMARLPATTYSVASSTKKAAASASVEKIVAASANKSSFRSTKRTRDHENESEDEHFDLLFDENLKSASGSNGKGRSKGSTSSSAAKPISAASTRSPNPNAAIVKLNLSDSPALRKSRAQTPQPAAKISNRGPTASQSVVASSLLSLSKHSSSSTKSKKPAAAAAGETQPAKRSRLVRLSKSRADSDDDELDFENSQRSHASSPQMGRVGRAESPSW